MTQDLAPVSVNRISTTSDAQEPGWWKFYSGQKLICVNAGDNGNGPTGLVENDEYTFLREYLGGVLIHEVDPLPCACFAPTRFCPAMTRKLDTSIFNSVLTPKKKVLEDA